MYVSQSIFDVSYWKYLWHEENVFRHCRTAPEIVDFCIINVLSLRNIVSDSYREAMLWCRELCSFSIGFLPVDELVALHLLSNFLLGKLAASVKQLARMVFNDIVGLGSQGVLLAVLHSSSSLQNQGVCNSILDISWNLKSLLEILEISWNFIWCSCKI